MRFQDDLISRFRLAGLIAVSLLVGPAYGEEVRSRPQVEKRIPASGKEALQCPAPGAGEMPRAAAPKREVSCYVDWPRAAEMLRSPAAVAIDVRPAATYTASHLPGALNIATDQIKSKSFLAGKPMLVYGSGRSDPRLEELCAEMKATKGGGGLKILSGGMVAWARAQGSEPAAPASAPDIRSLAELSATELIAELQAGDSQLVRVSPKYAHPEIDARSVRVEGHLSPDSLAAALQRSKGAKAYRRVVLVGVNDIGRKELQDVLTSSRSGVPVFFYAGDLQQFEASLKQMNALWAKKTRGPVASKCSFS